MGYQNVTDNRRLRFADHKRWKELNKLARRHRLMHVLRDGHCHEAVMWLVHHVPSEVAAAKFGSRNVPMLSRARHTCSKHAKSDERSVYDAYEAKVICAKCHQVVGSDTKQFAPIRKTDQGHISPVWPLSFKAKVFNGHSNNGSNYESMEGVYWYDFVGDRTRTDAKYNSTKPFRDGTQLWSGKDGRYYIYMGP